MKRMADDDDMDAEDFMDYDSGEAPSAAQVLYGRDRDRGGPPMLFEDGPQFGLRGRQNRGPQQPDEKIVDTDFFNNFGADDFDDSDMK